MSQMDEQLVQQVVEQVLAMLRQQGTSPAKPARATDADKAPAPFQPAMGICTGDYSKFPELAGRLHSKSPTADPAPPSAPASATDYHTPALTGIVTAQQLQDAIAASPHGVAMLDAAARPTPLANDLIRQSPDKVRRLDRTANHASGNAAQSAPWLWWTDGHCPGVQQITSQLASRLRASAASRDEAGLFHVVRDLHREVAASRIAGGLLFVRSSAIAVCYANRCHALRAVVGTNDETVEQGIRELGANVLIIEYPHTKRDVMQAMVQRVLAQSPKLPQHVRRQLAELDGTANT